MDKAARRLILLADKAITALESVLTDPTQKGASQKRYAAQAILSNVIDIWSLRNIEARIAILESNIYGEIQER